MAILRSSIPRISRTALPWQLATGVLAATALTVAGWQLSQSESRTDQPALVAEVQSVVYQPDFNSAVEAPYASFADGARNSYLTAEEWERSADFYPHIAIVTNTAIAATETLPADDSATSSVAVAQTQSTTTESATTTDEAPAAVAPAAAPAAQAPAAPPAPAVQAAPAGPVQRWASQGIVIVTEGQEWDDASMANVDAGLSAIPARLISSLGNPSLGSLHILVNTQGRSLSGAMPYGGAANYFSTNDGRNELILYPQQSVSTIVHELGHAYNLRRIPAASYALVLLDPEMRSFLTATGWQIQSSEAEIRAAVDHMQVRYTYTGTFHWASLSNDDPLEDFANSFSMFYLNPSGLQAQSPERYNWMLNNIGW